MKKVMLNLKVTRVILPTAEQVGVTIGDLDTTHLRNVTCQGQLQFARCQIPDFDAS